MKYVSLAVLVVFAMTLCSCTTTHQTRSAATSGFLKDYHQLREGGDGEALRVYINPATNFGSYDKILIDPIQVYASQRSKLAKLPNEDLQGLVNYLDATLREQLKADYTLVNAPGPNVMRLRVAITEAKGSKVVLDTLSTVMPYTLAISAVKRVALGSHTSVGMARVEMEIQDSRTQVRLVAAVDERAGRKVTGKFDKWKKWQDAKDAYDHWAVQLRTRLTELRTRGNSQ